MWYRIAQNKFNYTITQEGNFLKISLISPLNTNGLPEYPTINIFQSLPGKDSKRPIENAPQNYFETFEKLIPTQINQIFITVMNVLAKYPKGVLSNMASKGLNINVGKAIENRGNFFSFYKSQGPLGIASDPSNIFINHNAIISSLDHEIGHQIDESIMDIKNPNQPDKDQYKNMAPTGYARTNKWEAFAEGYDILAKKGFNYRFPETSEQNVRQNQLLDIVRKQVEKNPSNFKDFGGDIKFDSLQQKGQLSENSDKTKNYKSRRLSTLVGAFQNAIDRYSGNKFEYAKSFINDQQKIKDIVGFLNKKEYFFSIEPVTQDEIELALYRLSLSLDKTKDPSSFNFKDYTFKDRESKNPINQHIDNFYLPKKIKDFIEQHLDIYADNLDEIISNYNSVKPYHLFPEEKKVRYFKNKSMPEAVRYFMSANFPNKSDLQNLPQVSLLDEMAPVDQYQYEIGQKIINAISTKNSKYINNQANVDRIYQQLIKSIFPPLTFNNPEDYFLYDFQIQGTSTPTYQGIHSPNQMSSTSYSLDPNIVKQKINQVIEQDDFTKNLLVNVKQKIANDLYARIISLKDKYANLIQNNPKLKINFQSAVKAIDKLIASSIKTKGQIFMRIFNLNEWSDDQRQKLLGYYKSKQNETIRK